MQKNNVGRYSPRVSIRSVLLLVAFVAMLLTIVRHRSETNRLQKRIIQLRTQLTTHSEDAEARLQYLSSEPSMFKSQSEEIFPELVVFLFDSNASVRQQANELLVHCSEEDFGYDAASSENQRFSAVIRWLEWRISQPVLSNRRTRHESGNWRKSLLPSRPTVQCHRDDQWRWYDHRTLRLLGYGTPTVTDAAGTARTTSAENNRYTYTGREWDLDSGLYHYRARMYDSASGRFCSRDPIGYFDSKNVYTYVRANPMVFTDSFGLCAKMCLAKPMKIDNKGCHEYFEKYEDGTKTRCFGGIFTVDVDFEKPDCECCSYRQFKTCRERVCYFDKETKKLINCTQLDPKDPKAKPKREEDCTWEEVADPTAPGGVRKVRRCYGHRGDPPLPHDVYGECSYHSEDRPGICGLDGILKQIDANTIVVYDILCKFDFEINDTCLGKNVEKGTTTVKCRKQFLGTRK